MDAELQNEEVVEGPLARSSTSPVLTEQGSSSSSGSFPEPLISGSNLGSSTTSRTEGCRPDSNTMITTAAPEAEVIAEFNLTLQTPITPSPNPQNMVPAPKLSATPVHASTKVTSYFPTNPDIILEITKYIAVSYLHPDPELVLQDARNPFLEDGSDDLDDSPIGTPQPLTIPTSPLAILHRTRQTLLSTALTCKRLLEPALDRLWRHLDSLFPLLKLLPAFVRSDGTWVLRGPITQAHWTRFDYYAFRVRAFTFTRDPDTLDIAMHVYFRLAQLRAAYIPPSTSPYISSTSDIISSQTLSKGLPLLPNLHHLHCPCTSQTDFLISGICLFLSPSLRSLKFEGISSVEDKLCGTVLYELLGENSDGEYIEPSGVYKKQQGTDDSQYKSQLHQSSLECVTLRGRGLSYDTLRMLPLYSHLRVLSVEGMGDALTSCVLKGIGRLECLKVLGIDFANVIWDDVIGETSKAKTDDEAGEFKELRSLAIIAPLGVAHSFIKRLSTKNLDTISIESPFANPQNLTLTHPQVSKIDKDTVISHLALTWSQTLHRVELVLQPRDDDESEFDHGLPMPGAPMMPPIAPPPQMPGNLPPPPMGGWMVAPPPPAPNPPLNNPPNPPNMPNPQPPVIIVQPPLPAPPAPPPMPMPAATSSTYSNPNTITLNTLGPLLRLTKLTHLRVEGYPTSLNDEDVKEMAASWDCLEALELPFTSVSALNEGSNELKKPTTKCLAVLARSCQNLRSLKLSLDLDGVSSLPLPSMQPDSPRQASSSRWPQIYTHPLTHISLSPPTTFSSSPTFAPHHHHHDEADGVFELRDLLHLARHIDACFPEIKCVSMFDGLSSSGGIDGLLGTGSFWRDSFEDDSGYGGVNDFASVFNYTGEPERWHALSDTVRMYQGVRRDAVRGERWRSRVHSGLEA
ncbi:hypothetical protein CPB83DRAFT_809583 [Crepidotus variabilis]|uniref:F-box domain-containing protein n=1 Tax=Crepidotus variabilis TaxID=179855 RepID=A0A9P6EL91_9AGAR|nr:hypothetical protein CPB83DRAFT_809583 [Crepidotus variabilis]